MRMMTMIMILIKNLLCATFINVLHVMNFNLNGNIANKILKREEKVEWSVQQVAIIVGQQ